MRRIGSKIELITYVVGNASDRGAESFFSLRVTAKARMEYGVGRMFVIVGCSNS